MDSLTHIVTGACLGELMAGRKIGRAAMVWGAVVHSLPDIDIIASAWLSTTENLLAHRGITHSIIFSLVVATLLAFTGKRVHRRADISFSKWFAFIATALLLHIGIDAFNNYGTGWWEPFDNRRVAFNTLYVADPVFTIGALVAAVVLLLSKKSYTRRRLWAASGLFLSTFYLGYSIINKGIIDAKVKASLSEENIHYSSYMSTPAPLQNWLWFVVAGSDSGFHVGYRSLFDGDRAPDLQYFPKNEYLLDGVPEGGDINLLKRFSQGFYTLEQWHDTLVFNDLRFGQVIGWHDPTQPFAFHYFLQHPDANKLVVQRGRFRGWNGETATSFWKRIRGLPLK